MRFSIRRISALNRDEDGNVLITVIIISMLVGGLASLTLTTGRQADWSSASDRNHEVSLSVAEGGIHEAVSEIDAQVQAGAFPASWGPVPGSTPQGPYEFKVDRCQDPFPQNCLDMNVTQGYVIESWGRAGNQILGRERRVRAAIEPAEIFPGEDGPYSLFSYLNIDIKNGVDVYSGDVWANDSIIFRNGARVYGNVTSATSWIKGEPNTEAFGDIWSGGYHCERENPSDPSSPCITSKLWAIDLDGLIVHGSARASTFLPCADAPSTPHFDLRGGRVDNTVTTLGVVNGTSVGRPPARTSTCTPAAPKKELPKFDYNPANYTPAPLPFDSVEAFNDWKTNNPGTKSGTFVINEPSPSQVNRVDLSNWNISGDVTVITNAPITGDPISDTALPAGSQAKLVLVSHYKPPAAAANPCKISGQQFETSECAIHFQNHLRETMPCPTAILLYADNGPVAIKNKASMCGSIISNGILTFNQMTLNYDKRLDRLPGFGVPNYEISRWEEMKP